MSETEILKYIMPEMEEGIEIEQNKPTVLQFGNIILRALNTLS